MDSESQPQHQASEAQGEAELASLNLRVEVLERQIASLQELLLASRAAGSVEAGTGFAPPPPPPPVALQPDILKIIASTPLERTPLQEVQPQTPRASMENRIGSQLFSRVGIVALLVGATLFLKWAIDNHWIGPLGRVLAGLIAGAGLVVWSERFRRKGFGAFSYSLKAVGSGVLYLSLWAAFQLYHLLPPEVALVAMILVTAWNAYMAWSQNAEVLAAYALAGGCATPLLLSAGGNHEGFLFTYLLAIDLAMIALVRLKPWPRLLLAAFPATVAYFIGWYVQFNSPGLLLETSIFVALFFVAFASVAIAGIRFAARRSSGRASSITQILLPLGNAAFGSLAFYSLLQDSGHHANLPWLMVIFAAIYLALMRLPQSAVAAAIHLSLAIVFLTIAIPLKASGRWIIVSWLVEGTALLWVSARLAASVPEPDEGLTEAHHTLRWLSIGALLLGFVGLVLQPDWIYAFYATAFLNARFATALVGITAFAMVAWISVRARGLSNNTSQFWLHMAGASIIAVNIVAILACVREIEAYWSHGAADGEAGLQRALSISAFLMFYGATLLAIGFWRRTAFIRWQALLLLVFTIGKTFLYDMRSLSQGYRVASFLALGALLMTVSFAYQKDWLDLRGPQPDTPGALPNESNFKVPQ